MERLAQSGSREGMTFKEPPRLPTWLLQHLGCGSDNDAVLGDLAERYRQGKTSFWYWKEVAVAIVVSAFNDIRSHKLLTLRAMIVGGPVFWYLGYWAFDFLALFTRTWPPDWLYSKIGPSLWFNHEQFVAWYWYGDSAAGSVLMIAIGMISGWILARLNWRHRRSIVLLFSLSVLLSWIYYSWTATVEDIGASIFWEAYFWINNILQVLAVLAGGLMEIRSSYRTRLKKELRQIVQAVPLRVRN